MITNKEAIKRIKEIIEEVKLCGVEQGNKDIEALDLAIKALEERPQGEINADLFKQIFGIYATELWSMSESQFLEWLNEEYKENTNGEI